MNCKLNTSRISLIPFERQEYELFHDLNSQSFIRKYLWDDEIITLDSVHQILEQNEKHFQHDHFGIWKINLPGTDETIGFTGLWYFFGEAQPQLIYALKESQTAKGYATEAAQAIITYAFEKLSFTYLIAAMDQPHMASQKLAERLGMKFIELRMENDKPTVFYRIDKYPNTGVNKIPSP
ncbi:ribosomal-protein-alanine N-acetyltransferase [Catalinimonas alkaloidigena]|uniref:GNAT family N-acetyltransferase n=1 Tax=Catalinimonas alkaloidigena TaxID=1075417 RepID=UPI0024049882|nr:GNAT family N-acetyltransferase [Catalinimonas alkaloidigena]MDF9796611.1 ribosomal-protein-alanine N-acetyltransferase [Catalinimonas alkaloidigena]